MSVMAFFTGISANGIIQVVKPDPCVSQHMLLEILLLQSSGKSLLEAVDQLRQKTVPAGYTVHPWTEGQL